jgi:nitroimidazol reductase NimA-like FMN-containing flavoprotein (pyridoxamine 5'-phosphate oxidase superfamily)
MEKLKQKAKKIISEIIYITIATVSKGGEPWNTPVYSAFDESYNFYWASDKNGQHSKNIKANENVFIVIYDSTVPQGTGEGLYIKAKAYEITDRAETEKASKLLAARKNKNPRNADEYLGEYPRRVYKAVPEKFWMNGDGKINGNYIDTRVEVDLLY